MLLSTALFPPIQFFCKIVDLEYFFLESMENYQERSYRNRFVVSGANGPIRLSIPIIKRLPKGKLIKDVRLDPSDNWRKVHLKTVQSAYKHSPFYEFYFDDLLSFWEKDWKYLYDYNLEILITILEMLELNINIKETTEYSKYSPGNDHDLRELIHPKRSWKYDSSFNPHAYIQNFSDRFEFIPNLSIIDLIFQAGPDTVSLIRKSKVTKI